MKIQTVPLPFVMFFMIQSAHSSALIKNRPWDNTISAPEIMSFYFKKNFHDLPLAGGVSSSTKFWSGDYWALNKGNINYRWHARYKIGFNLNSPSMEEAKKMSIPELAELAPSEKYDLLTGSYNYPFKKEVNKIADPKALIWEGICHGWSAATMNHNEPMPKLLKNPDGIEIPFGSTDIKALISYYYAYSYAAPDTYQMGSRCFDNNGRMNNQDCGDDLNAGAFHIVLANRIGLEGKSFVADLKRFREVWNHPVTRFESQIQGEYNPGPYAARNAVKVIRMKTKIEYVDGGGIDWRPVLRTSKQESGNETYIYDVELDKNGEIIGGEWISFDRPDFLWYMNRPRQFQGTLARLNELLND